MDADPPALASTLVKKVMMKRVRTNESNGGFPYGGSRTVEGVLPAIFLRRWRWIQSTPKRRPRSDQFGGRRSQSGSNTPFFVTTKPKPTHDVNFNDQLTVATKNLERFLKAVLQL